MSLAKKPILCDNISSFPMHESDYSYQHLCRCFSGSRFHFLGLSSQTSGFRSSWEVFWQSLYQKMFAIGVALMKAFEFWPRARMLMKFAGRISRTRLTTKASPLLGVHNSLELAILFPNSSTSEFTRWDNNHNYNPPLLVISPSSLPTSRAQARAWPSYHHKCSHQ